MLIVVEARGYIRKTSCKHIHSAWERCIKFQRQRRLERVLEGKNDVGKYKSERKITFRTSNETSQDMDA
jgi:hypothetical protein